MRIWILICLACWLMPTVAAATVVDSAHAEQLYKSGDYEEAREAFLDLLDEFSAVSKDSTDYRAYRELAYIYDRLSDCCFTQRDWPMLKLYMDGMLEVTYAEQNLVENQLSGAIASGVARATASYLYDRVDESVRITSIVPLKRSLALLLLDSDGEGNGGDGAIHQYQCLAAAMVNVLEVDSGFYELNVPRLEQKIEEFTNIHAEIEKLGDLEELWLKYPPPTRVEGAPAGPNDSE